MTNCKHKFSINPHGGEPDCELCGFKPLDKIAELEARLKAYEMHYGIITELSQQFMLEGKANSLLTESEWKQATGRGRG